MVMFASKEDALLRIEICNSCERKTLLVCMECSCLVTAKVRLNNAKCPLDKWLEVPAKLAQPWDVDTILNVTDEIL